MTLEAGQHAPDLDRPLTDANGEQHTLRDALGRGPVVLGIYKSSCQASKTMFPILERLAERYRDAGVSVFGVSQDSPNVTRSFARRAGVTFPLLIDGEGYRVSRDYDISATPTVFLIDQDGTIGATTMGFFKMMVNEFGVKVAAAAGAPATALVGEEGADAEIPPFVPG